MKTIDEQIAELEKAKAKEKHNEQQKFLAEITEKGKTMHGKSYIKFGGANMVGDAYWEVIYVRDSRAREDYNKNPCLELYADCIYIHCAPALLAKHTYYDEKWSDPEYNKTGGTNGHKTLTEGLSGGKYSVRTSFKKDGRAKKVPLDQLQTADISEVPMTPYSSWMKVEYPLSKDFSNKYVEIPNEKYEEIITMTENIQNYIWSNMESLYNKDYRKVWSSGIPLAITQRQKTVAEKHIDLLNKALDSSGRTYRRNVIDEFLEFLNNKK
jgi:6-pyruvoyl-tetrahydropterin synthase